MERFFARYRTQEVEAMLLQAGFVLLDYHRSDAGSRRWLQFPAQKLPEGGA